MKRTLLLVSFALFVSSCAGGPQFTLLIHPKTGERVRCMAILDSYGTVLSQEARKYCVAEYQALGFVQAQDLSPEQRATVVSKERPIVIEQR